MESSMESYSIFNRTSLAEKQLASKLGLSLDKKKLFSAIDSNPETFGAGVRYIDSKFTIVTLREFQPICSIKPVYIILKEPSQVMSANEYSQSLASNTRQSKLTMEGLSTTLACAGAVLSWIVVISSAAVVPVTGGASSAVTVLSYSAAIASSAQCGIGLVRTGAELVDPSLNDWMDSQEWFGITTTALDVISIGGAAASGLLTVKYIKTLAAQGVTVKAALTKLSRAERKRLTQEIIRANMPGISSKMMKAMQRAGTFPKRYTSIQLSRSTQLQIKDALAATLAFSGSALSGTMRNLAIGVYEEIDL